MKFLVNVRRNLLVDKKKFMWAERPNIAGPDDETEVIIENPVKNIRQAN